MTKKYVRFVVAGGYDSPKLAWRRWHPLSLTGVITIASLQMKKGKFNKKEKQVIKDIFSWFNENIPCPPFQAKQKAKEWSDDCFSWWRITARKPINKLRPLIKILRENGMVVRTLYAERLANIRYRDKFQVVTEVEWPTKD